MKMFSRIAGLLCAAASIALAGPVAGQSAAGYPNKPVRVILPFAPPGGGLGTAGRIIFDRVTREVGQPFVFDFRPGGGTSIGTQAVVRAAPDGYTLLGVTSSISITQWTTPDLAYDTLKDLLGITTMATAQSVLVLHASVPPNNMKEFIAYARQNPDKVNARMQAGTITHVAMLLLQEAIGAQLTLVSYKGSGQADADMLSGVLQLSLTSPGNVIPHIKAGKLKAIAIAGSRRIPILPDTPTFAEAGLKDLKIGNNWHMLLAPAATPRDIVEKLNAMVGRAQAAKDVQEMVAKAGLEVYPNSVADTNALLRTEFETFGKVVRQHNIKAEGG